MANTSSFSNQRSRRGESDSNRGNRGNQPQTRQSAGGNWSGSAGSRGTYGRADQDRSRGFGHGDEIERYSQTGQSGFPGRGRSQSDQRQFGRGDDSERNFNSQDWQGGPVQQARGRDRDDWSTRAQQGNAGHVDDRGRHEGRESRFFHRDDEGYVGGMYRSGQQGRGEHDAGYRSNRGDYGAYDEREGSRFGGSSNYDSARGAAQWEHRDYDNWGNTGRNEQFDPYQASNRREGDAYDSRRGDYEERNRNYGNYAGERGPSYSGSSVSRQDEDYEERGDDYIAGRSRGGSREDESYYSSRSRTEPGRSSFRSRD